MRHTACPEAVVWSGLMNFVGVPVGGISVALVEILPAEVLSPPGGAPAVAMLVALLVAALFRAPAPGSATADHTVVTILIAGSLYYLLESPAFDIGI